VIGQDRNQLILVFRQEQVFDGPFRQGREGVIGGGENGERAFALQGFDQTCGAQSSGEGGERTGVDGGVNNILAVCGSTDGGGEGGGMVSR